MESRGNYPNYMDYQIITNAYTDFSEYWEPWKMVEIPNCSFAPTYKLETVVSQDKEEQLVVFDIFYD